MTIPNGLDPDNRNHVVWTDAADAVWSDMAHDLPIVTTEAPGSSPTSSASAAQTQSPTGAGTSAPTTTMTEPTPTETKTAGREPFTGSDLTATCG